MEAVIFIGVQASGKSTFYQQRFSNTHVRINLDMLKQRRREDILLRACLEAHQRFVVDNTNPTAEVRSKYIRAAKAAHFRVIGYYFRSSIADALERNARRSGRACIPEEGIRVTYEKVQPPALAEGFDELFCVTISAEGTFVVERCRPR